jgi:hypothetical protein
MDARLSLGYSIPFGVWPGINDAVFSPQVGAGLLRIKAEPVLSEAEQATLGVGAVSGFKGSDIAAMDYAFKNPTVTVPPTAPSALSVKVMAKLNANHHFVNLSRLALNRAQFAAAGDMASRETAARSAAEVLSSLEKILGADHPDVIDATGHVGLMLAQSGSAAEGLAMLERVDRVMSQSKTVTRRDRDESALRLGVANALSGNNAAAEQKLLDLMQTIQPGQISTSLRAACVNIASTIEPREQFRATIETWSAGLPQNR